MNMRLPLIITLAAHNVGAFTVPTRSTIGVQKVDVLETQLERYGAKPNLSFHYNVQPRNRKSSIHKHASKLFSSISSNSYDEQCDVLVLGSGPAARAIAALLSSPKCNLDVILADSNYDRKWPPNYGTWEG